MSKERLEDIKDWYEYNSNNDWKMMAFDKGNIVWLIEQAERVQELGDIIYQDERQAVLEGLYEENETLRSANEDLIKENHTLKNFNKIDIDHPSNKFF